MTTAERQRIDFSVFLMHQLAKRWNRSVPDVYLALEQAGALSNYIYPSYDVLHTLSGEYLTDDVTDYVREHGVRI